MSPFIPLVRIHHSSIISSLHSRLSMIYYALGKSEGVIVRSLHDLSIRPTLLNLSPLLCFSYYFVFIVCFITSFNNQIYSMKLALIPVLLLTLFLTVDAEYNATLGKLLGQLTVSSYCIEKQVTSWTCLPCKKVSNMKFVQVFKNRTNDTCGYIGVNDAEDAASNTRHYSVLVFRGTLPWDVKNWVSDINFLKKKYPYCDNGC